MMVRLAHGARLVLFLLTLAVDFAGVGTTVNASHRGRLHGTPRCRQARLTRRGRYASRGGRRLGWSLWRWRDLYKWARVHGSLSGRKPAKAIGLSDRVWTVPEYVRYPVHLDGLWRQGDCAMMGNLGG